MSVPGSMPLPILSFAIRSRILGLRRSAVSPTATISVWAMQRSPAEPKPAATAASATRSMSASGRTSIAFLAEVYDPTRLPRLVPSS